MKKEWNHLDIIVTVGICATVLGAGIFFFALGGAPTGILDDLLGSQAPSVIDPQGLTQANLGTAIVKAQTIRYREETGVGPIQERLGDALVAAAQVAQARTAFVPGLHAAARQSLVRMWGMIQESAGRSLVLATQRMWREGTTDTAQLQFIETLGGIKAGMILREQASRPLREEALGWSVVGGWLSMENFAGQVQELLGSALMDAGTMTVMVETERPLAQESLGSALLVASRSAAAPMGSPSVLTASAAGFPGGERPSEIPYQAAVILFGAVFVLVWGARSMAESGRTLPTYEAAPSRIEDHYRKTA
jgi:hypothetical protein